MECRNERLNANSTEKTKTNDKTQETEVHDTFKDNFNEMSWMLGDVMRIK